MYLKNIYKVFRILYLNMHQTTYPGPVGPQGGAYVGGYDKMQTYIAAPWDFEVVGSWPLH